MTIEGEIQLDVDFSKWLESSKIELIDAIKKGTTWPFFGKIGLIQK